MDCTSALDNHGLPAPNSVLHLYPEKDGDLARSIQNFHFLSRHYNLPQIVTFMPGVDRLPNRAYVLADWKTLHGEIHWEFQNFNWDDSTIRSAVQSLLSPAAQATQELIQQLGLSVTLPELPIEIDYRGLDLNEEALIYTRVGDQVLERWIKSSRVVCPEDMSHPDNPVSNARLKRYREQYNQYVIEHADCISRGTHFVVDEDGIHQYESYQEAMAQRRTSLSYYQDYQGLDSQNYILQA